MEVRLLNGNYMPDGWLANQLTGFWKDFAREGDNGMHTRPATDVVEDAEGYHFYFDMPGLKSDSVDVRVEDGLLVIEAERPRPQWAKDAQVHLNERNFGPIRRSFRIPEDSVQDGISAGYRDGILTVNVTKQPEKKPLRVKVNSD